MTIRLLIYLGYYGLSLLVLKDPLAFVITLPMMLLVLYNVAQIRERYLTIDDMVHFVIYIFFVVEPIQMIDNGRIGEFGPVSRVVYTDRQMILAMVIAFLFYGTLSAMRWLFAGRAIRYRAFVIERRWSLAILATLSATFVLYVLLTGGISAVLSSRYTNLLAQANQTSSSVGAMRQICLGILAMQVTLLATMVRRRFDQAMVCFTIALVMLMICYNPFNAARFGLLGAYVPLGLTFLNGRVRAAAFYGASMFGIIVLFPILNISTRYGMAGFSEHSDQIAANALSLQFVDTYDLLVECVSYVDRHGFDWGQKLLADLVIYAPREWWPNKPVLGGLDVGYQLLYGKIFGTANVSQIVAADGYMDFGLAGVLLVAVLVGLFFQACVYGRRYLINGHNLYGYALIASLPILTRGPIGAVITLFLFQTVTLIVVRRLVGREVRVAPGTRPLGIGVTPMPPAEAPRARARPLPPAQFRPPPPARPA